jgi:lysophospholipase L1-like esterase
MGLLGRALLRRLRPGAGVTLDAVEPFRAVRDASNEQALDGSGPLWLALGDSTAQGIGASAPDRGYVGQLRARLEARDGRPWRVVNASRSGARLRDVVTNQLGWLETLPSPPDLVTCAAGANDVTWRPGRRGIVRDLHDLMDRLPSGTVIATLPKGLGRRRTEALNDVIAARAPELGLVVADVWANTGAPYAGRLAVDHFHPSDLGYARWATAFGDALGLPESAPGARHPDA